MKKVIFNPENPNGLEVELTSDEIAINETNDAKTVEQDAKEETDKQAQIDLKASAKAKLIAGEKLTEEEANILVGV
tara:strand:+ start:14 stop:241 length:228 start_codon:yes stop_codon:yes gene_type:complete